MKKVCVVYHSGSGHTKRQAEAVHRGAAAVESVEAMLLTTDEAADRLDQLDAADAIVFGAPTYMGSLSAEMKRFFEVAAKKWAVQAWEDKLAGGFTNSGSLSGDKLSTLSDMFYFAMQQGMIWVSLGMLPSQNDRAAVKTIHGPGPDAHNRSGSFVGPMASSFECGPDVAPSKGDLETAALYGQRLAEVALRMQG
ncbi:MAG: flavodoxin family protein [Acidobacteriota bacterium]|jgi:NAD(P)H dehydrogenase (quinone)